MNRRLPQTVRSAIEAASILIVGIYGGRLERLLLFGSFARGDSQQGSDVDVLVVLADPVDTLAEIRRLAPVSMEIWSRFSVDVQLMPFSAERYADPFHPFVRNVRKDATEIGLVGARA